MLADIAGEALLRYDRAGQLVERVPKPASGVLSYDVATEIQQLPDGGYVLRSGSTFFLLLDEELQPVDSFDLIRRGARWQDESGMIGGARSFAIWNGEFVGLSPVAVEDRVLYAIVRFRLEDEEPARAEPIPPVSAVEERFLSATSGWGAKIDSGVYAMLPVDEHLALERIAPSSRRLDTFPDDLATVPPIPDFGGREGTAATFAYLEQSRLPVKLYGRGAHLYLLSRQPGARGTEWLVHQIDPAKDELVRTLTLPTHANHIVLVPGPDHWAVVEKGPVAGPGQQAIPTAVLVPSEWIESPGSTTLTGAGEVTCTRREPATRPAAEPVTPEPAG